MHLRATIPSITRASHKGLTYYYDADGDPRVKTGD